MQRSRRVTIALLLVMSLLAVVGCGGSSRKSSTVPHVEKVPTLTYRPGVALHAQVAKDGREPSLRLEKVSYTSVDGERVPALFAIPTGSSPLGCLMYQGGLGQAKEAFPQLRAGAAAIRLATFTIDPRNGGGRGSIAETLAALKTPESLLTMVLDTVADLRVGLDYLERQPQCHHNIAYLGTSFGAVVGVLASAQDPRIKAVVLTSVGPTFKEAMLVGGVAAKKTPDVPVQVPGAATNPAILAHALSILSPYDPDKWISKIAPRPVLLMNGRFDPLVYPADALQLAAAASEPKTVVYFNGGHDPFAAGPDQANVTLELAQFLSSNLGLPSPL